MLLLYGTAHSRPETCLAGRPHGLIAVMYSESSLILWAILGEDCTPAARTRWSRRLRRRGSWGTTKSRGWRTPIGKRAGARAARRGKTGCARNTSFARETSVDNRRISPLWPPGHRLRSEEHTSELQSLRHLVCR